MEIQNDTRAGGRKNFHDDYDTTSRDDTMKGENNLGRTKATTTTSCSPRSSRQTFFGGDHPWELLFFTGASDEIECVEIQKQLNPKGAYVQGDVWFFGLWLG